MTERRATSGKASRVFETASGLRWLDHVEILAGAPRSGADAAARKERARGGPESDLEKASLLSLVERDAVSRRLASFVGVADVVGWSERFIELMARSAFGRRYLDELARARTAVSAIVLTAGEPVTLTATGGTVALIEIESGAYGVDIADVVAAVHRETLTRHRRRPAERPERRMYWASRVLRGDKVTTLSTKWARTTASWSSLRTQRRASPRLTGDLIDAYEEWAEAGAVEEAGINVSQELTRLRPRFEKPSNS